MTLPFKHDLWRWPALLLWVAFFYMGLFPVFSFNLLRDIGNVYSRHAMINSPYVLILSLCGYLGYFVYLRCREIRCTYAEAQGKGLQITLIAFFAFLPIGLDQFGLWEDIYPLEGLRIMWGFATVKCIAWLYLMSLILRYYLLQGPSVFLGMTQLFGRMPRQTNPPPQRSIEVNEIFTEPEKSEKSDD